MTNAIREVVAQLSENDCISIMEETEEWERTGVVRDDATLRRVAELINIPGILTLIMNDIVREVWRRLAMERVDQLSRESDNG